MPIFSLDNTNRSHVSKWRAHLSKLRGPFHRPRRVSISTFTRSESDQLGVLPCLTQSKASAEECTAQTPTAGTFDTGSEKPQSQSPPLSTHPSDTTLDVDASRPDESETDNSPERTIHTFLQQVFYPSATEEQRPGHLCPEEVEVWNQCASVLRFVAGSSLLVESKSRDFGTAGTKLLSKLGGLRSRTLSWVYPMFQREDKDEHGKHLDGWKQCFDMYDEWKRQWSETDAYDHQAIYSSLKQTWSNCWPMMKESPNGGLKHREGYELRK